MRSSFLDEILKENAIAQIDTPALLLLLSIACCTGFILARIFKNQYDPKPLINAYFGYSILHFLIGIFLLEMMFILVLGTYILGGVLVALQSNRYFYE